MLNKKRLLTPGPTPLPEEVRLALAQDMIHHRKGQFKEIMQRVQSHLRELFGTTQPVLPLSCSGSGAMTAAVYNLFAPGEKVLVAEAGKFGERWVEIARSRGLECTVLSAPWGQAVKAGDVAAALDADPDIRGVLIQMSETSTGVLHPVREVAAITRTRNVLCVVDGISGVSLSPCPMDQWGVDCLVTGSQKGLMLPPGLALLASYIEEIRIGLTRIGQESLTIGERTVDVHTATFTDFMHYYDVTLMNPKVLSGVFIGAMMAFLFCGLTMNAVGRAAARMVEEVRRQFREIKGILTGEAQPDYARCVEISTKGAQHEMVLPSLLAIIAPLLTGFVFGVPGVIGLLVGGLGAGFVLAIFMANAGGAWDNAKKYTEEGHLGGKGGEVHKATVVGDTVGDPFKDTSGPSLNILIKLMSMVAIVMAGLTVAWSLF